MRSECTAVSRLLNLVPLTTISGIVLKLLFVLPKTLFFAIGAIMYLVLRLLELSGILPKTYRLILLPPLSLLFTLLMVLLPFYLQLKLSYRLRSLLLIIP